MYLSKHMAIQTVSGSYMALMCK